MKKLLEVITLNSQFVKFGLAAVAAITLYTGCATPQDTPTLPW